MADIPSQCNKQAKDPGGIDISDRHENSIKKDRIRTDLHVALTKSAKCVQQNCAVSDFLKNVRLGISGTTPICPLR